MNVSVDSRATNGVMSVSAKTGTSFLVATAGLRWPLFVLSIAFAFVVYWPTVASIFDRWFGDPTYSHGFLIAAVAAWMVWRTWRRGELEGTRPSWFGLLPLATAGLLWLVARGAGIQVVQQLMLPALLLGTAWALFGWHGFIVLLVPIGVLYFVLPAWDYIRLPLQDLTVDAVGGFLHVAGVPAYIHGHRVDLPAGSFEIVEGCSGLHFFMAGAALAAIQAYLYIGANWARGLLMAAALAVAIVANWIRVTAVIVAGHLTDMQHFLVVKDHYYFGWVVFGILMIPVIWLGHRLEFTSPPAPAPSPRPPLSFRLDAPFRIPSFAALVVLLLPGLSWWAVYASATFSPPPVLPVTAGNWRLEGEAAPDWRPLQPGATLELNGRYTDGRQEVDAWVVYYQRQANGRELVGFGNEMARPGDGVLSAGDLGPGKLRLTTGRHHDRLIWYRYEVNGRVTTSAVDAKLDQLIGTLRGRPSAYGAIFSSRCMEPSCADARQALGTFESDFATRLPALELE